MTATIILRYLVGTYQFFPKFWKPDTLQKVVIEFDLFVDVFYRVRQVLVVVSGVIDQLLK